MKFDRRNMKIVIGFLCLILFFAAVVLGIHAIEKGKVVNSDDDSTTIVENGTTYRLKRNIETLLLIGLDDFGETTESDAYYNTEQADFLLLFVFDKDNETVSAIQINRDTMTNNPVLGIGGARAGHAYEQIALSHTYGSGGKISCQNTVESVSDLLMGITIDHYASVTMDAVKILNDSIGGVTVKITEDLTSINPSFKEGAKVTLKGDQALDFVRARMNVTDGTNISRMSRQRTYMDAFIEKAKKLDKVEDDSIIKLLDEMSNYLVSDCSIERLDALYDLAEEYDFTGIDTLKGEAKDGEKFVEYYVDETMLKQTVLDVFYERVN